MTAAALSRETKARQRLSKRARLRKRQQFLRVQHGGRRFSGQHYLVICIPTPQGEMQRSTHTAKHTTDPRRVRCRLGITVSTKVGTAVTRNRVKRWVRECYRRQPPSFAVTMDLVVVARPSAAKAGYESTCGELRGLWKRVAAGTSR